MSKYPTPQDYKDKKLKTFLLALVGFWLSFFIVLGLLSLFTSNADAQSSCGLQTAEAGHTKSFCAGTVISNHSELKTLEGDSIFTLNKNDRVEVNWLSQDETRYMVTAWLSEPIANPYPEKYRTEGEDTVTIIFGWVDKTNILLDTNISK